MKQMRFDSVVLACLVLLVIPCGLSLAAGIGHAGLTVTPAGALCAAPVVAYMFAVTAVSFPYSRAIQQMEDELTWNRASELVRRVELSQPVSLRGWVPLIFSFPYLVTTLWAATATALNHAWPAFFVALALAAFGIWIVMRNVPHLDAPLLSIEKDGVRTGAHGKLRWEEIEGIYLNRVAFKGFDFYSLEMLIPALCARTNTMHPCTRMLYRFRRKARRNRIELRLGLCGESPRAIELACTTLWERAVGRKDPWFPHHRRIQNELQEQRRRLDEEDRRQHALAEKELAKHGISLADALGRAAASGPRPPGFRDKLARSRPIQNERRKREIARVPAYRLAAVASILVIVGLLVIAFRVAETGLG